MGTRPAFEAVYDAIRDLPSFHVYGLRDPVKVMTNRLVASFAAPEVVQHERGHVVPRLGAQEAEKLVGFLRRWCGGRVGCDRACFSTSSSVPTDPMGRNGLGVQSVLSGSPRGPIHLYIYIST